MSEIKTERRPAKDSVFALRMVDATELSSDSAQVLRPHEMLSTRSGFVHRLPRFFYEIPDHDTSKSTRLTPHFELWEFVDTDLHEHQQAQRWPKYIPCAVTLLSAQLELFRDEVKSYVHISTNGGYRSPAHALSTHASTHCWGTAVNIHRIGDELLNDQSTIEKFAAIARRTMPGVYVRPYGKGVGEATDHLHIDLGYLEIIPHNISESSELLPATELNGSAGQSQRKKEKSR